MTGLANELDAAYALEPEAVEQFRAQGFVKLPDVMPTAALDHYGPLIADIVEREDYNAVPMAERSPYGQAFTQITNLWTRHESIRPFVFNRRCARIAAELLGCSGVRMWHDQALFKEARGGVTHWHCDQFFWPFSSDRCVTAWIPLQETPVDCGALQFAEGSHEKDYGRHLGIGERGDREIGAALEADGRRTWVEAFALGDVSFHAGWTFHRAEANASDEDRAVMTVIYMDEDMRVAEPANPFQEFDQRTWAPGCAVGEVIASEINPVIYSAGDSSRPG